ncbi:platelet glycoprotein VI [Ochotona princeps]|uniref:platelet glycoprotein VI n=1 Tax=Ochotona princeps TaxID=9978 RepID=UPI002714E957|nr:platelet glycoprotein VI [Ochotona princeps]
MAPPVRSLFCLGLWLAQVARARHGPLPRPTLQALPSALVPLGSLVTLRCRGPPGVDLYRLEQLGTRKYSDQDVLVIPALDSSSVGRYRCSYQNGNRWSPASEPLELVAVGVFDKPQLSAIPGPVVRSGEDVTLQCQTGSGFDQFALSKEGQARPQKRPESWYQASFPLVTVTAAHSGIYRCYSYASTSPYLWSAPSDPLQLVVTASSTRPGTRRGSGGARGMRGEPAGSSANSSGSAGGAHPLPAHTARPPLPSSLPLPPDVSSHTPASLARLCLGALLLVLLVGLVVEDWHSRRHARRRRRRVARRPLPPLPHSPTPHRR